VDPEALVQWTPRDLNTVGTLVAWPGTIINHGDLKDFGEWFKTEFGAPDDPEPSKRITCTVVGCVTTLPDTDDDGRPVEGTGGRHDFIFGVKGPGIGAFALKRLRCGMRWLSDVCQDIYPLDFRDAFPVASA
jgi:hypothetical protein